MLTREQFDQVARLLPVIRQAEGPFQREFIEKAFYIRIPKGRDVFVEGDRAEAIALLVSGVVRVYKMGETGREITLYRFGGGGSCILTANAILGSSSFPAIATVEADAEAVMVPAEVFKDWVKRFDAWRLFVFDLLSERLASMLVVVDEVLFQHMDRRVAALLLKRSVAGHRLQITHQEMAAELGSSREVISRILEDFVQKGMLKSGRRTIEILDAEALKSL